MADHHRAHPSTQPRARTIDADFRPEAVIFDCDGILLDTESNWTLVQESCSRRYGVEFGPEDQRRMMGWAARDVAADIAARGRVGVEAVMAHLLSTEAQILSRSMPVIDGAVALVRRVSAQVPTAVASNSTAQILRTKLSTSGFAQHLVTWVSSDDVPAGKPAPDIYLEAARRLGVTPEACLAVEDSPAGATAAIRAGMITVGAPSEPNGEPVPASLLVDSLTDPALDRLLKRWSW